MVRAAPLSAWLSRLALAYLLVLQAVLGGAALGLSARAGLATGGTVWCAGGGAGTGSPSPDAPHHDLACTLCCVAGVHQPGLAGGGGPGVVIPHRRAFAAEFADRAAAPPPAAHPTPFDARGPPEAA